VANSYYLARYRESVKGHTSTVDAPRMP
jgi:hypothetical protein